MQNYAKLAFSPLKIEGRKIFFPKPFRSQPIFRGDSMFVLREGFSKILVTANQKKQY